MIKRIGVLTSGGDAPGMNAVIRAVVRSAAAHDIQVIGIKRGYSGLINGDFMPLDKRSVSGITSRGGTMLYTARSEEFRTQAGLKKGADACKYLGIEALVAIGGDGTFRGANDLQPFGIKSVGIPATIDNDISCTDYTIGFDTACNTAIDAIDKLSDTMQSHERISVVEVMGRNAGYLALNVAVSCGAAAVLLPEVPLDFQADVVERIREGRISGKSNFIVIIAEGLKKTDEVAQAIAFETGLETRVTIIGHVQRGGKPSSYDRVMAARMGNFAAAALAQGLEQSGVVSLTGSEIRMIPIVEALQKEKQIDLDLLNICRDIAR